MRPHRWQPTRLPHPWHSPGKNTGVGCHFLLQCMKVKSESEFAQLCPTLSDPMDCSPPGSSVHGIFQARVLEWGAIAFSACGDTCLILQAIEKMWSAMMYWNQQCAKYKWAKNIILILDSQYLRMLKINVYLIQNIGYIPCACHLLTEGRYLKYLFFPP